MIEGKIVLITGASSGIGAKTAILLAKKGAIPILAARSKEKLEQVSSQIKTEHEIIVLDVTDNEQVIKTVEYIINKYKKIDVLINNAGFGVFKNVVDANMEEYQEMIDVNYLGMVRCVKSVLPYMLKEKSGHIINVASVAGKIATAKAAGYSATKFAMIGFSNGLRQEVKKAGIYVSTVNPGPIDTPFFDRADPSGDYVNNIKWLLLRSEQVAKSIIRVIETKKIDKTIPFLANIGAKLYQLFPKTFDKVLGKQLNRK